MDELLDRLVAKVGIDRGVAEKAVGIILAFLLKEGPSDKVQALINQMPGAVSWLASSQALHARADVNGSLSSSAVMSDQYEMGSCCQRQDDDGRDTQHPVVHEASVSRAHSGWHMPQIAGSEAGHGVLATAEQPPGR